MYRKIEKQDLVGKTIVDLDAHALNCLVLTFSDGQELKIWAEIGLSTQFGDIPGLFVDGETK